MGVPASLKAVEALKALKALQEDAERKGLSQMSMDEIDAEIAAYRGDLSLKTAERH